MPKTNEILEKMGYRRLFAATLGVMIDHQGQGVTLRDIETWAQIRQPEASIAMGQLIDRKWVTQSTKPMEEGERGRKCKLYRLKPAPEIYVAIEREQFKGLQEVQANLGKLKKAMKVDEPEMMVAKSGQPDSTTVTSAPVIIQGTNSSHILSAAENDNEKTHVDS